MSRLSPHWTSDTQCQAIFVGTTDTPHQAFFYWTTDASDYQHLPTLQSNTTGDSLSRQYTLPNTGRNKKHKL